MITTRFAPRDLRLQQPGRQRQQNLDQGLESPHAENILREMDADGSVGLREAPDALLDKARRHTRGFPRALEALFAILSADRYTSLEEILLTAMPDNVVEALVGQAYSRLDSTGQQVMQALAVYDRPISPAAIDYLLQPYQPTIDSTPILNRLVNMHFVRREAGCYYLHSVDRDYAFEQIPMGEEADRDTGALHEVAWSRYALLSRGADYFHQTQKPRSEWKKLDDLSPQLAEFELRCAGGEYNTAADLLTDIDFNYLFLWGHARLTAQLHEQLLGQITDDRLRGISLSNLGLAYADLGEVEKAIGCYEQALSISLEIGDRRAQGAVLGSLGNAYRNLGEVEKAIGYYEQALSISLEIGDRRAQGNRLGNLGLAYADLGEVEKAIGYYEQALSISLEIGHRRAQGADLGNLGLAYADLGEVEKAIGYYEQALSIPLEIGHRRAQGNHLGNLGLAYADLGEVEKAIGYYEQGLAISLEIGDRSGESIDSNNIGELLLIQGRWQDAIQQYERAIQIADEIKL